MSEKKLLYNEIYFELAELLGEENAEKMHEMFKGQQVTFPVRLYDTRLIKEMVRREYDGTNLKALVSKYGYCEKTLRRMLRDSNN